MNIRTMSLLTCLAGSASANPNFIILTPQGAGFTDMRVNSVSGDGTFAVGQLSAANPLHAARWSASNVAVDIGLLSGRPYSNGTYLSHDGSIAAADALNGSFNPQVFRWTAPSTKLALPFMTGGTFCYSSGLSSDGSVIAGWGDIAGGVQRMWRWTSATGTVIVPLPAGLGANVSANASLQATRNLSGNGRYVVGTTVNAYPVNQGFIYDAVTGVSTNIGQLQAGEQPYLTSISNDGTVVLGYSSYQFSNGNYSQAGFRWTAQDGFQLLGSLGDGTEPVLPRFMSGDGKTVLGTSNGKNFIWTLATGMQSFDAYLSDRGVNTLGMTNLEFAGLSDDGTIIVGMGDTSTDLFRGWMLNVPHCPGDFNFDGFVDIYDFTQFVSCFEGGACPPGQTADYNGDGFADVYDFTDFVTAFEAGC